MDVEPHDLLVGTYSIFAMGMDIGYIDTLLLVTPRRSVTQAVGRLRSGSKFKDRQPLLILDILDAFSFFLGQHAARKRVYRKRKYQVLDDVELDYDNSRSLQTIALTHHNKRNPPNTNISTTTTTTTVATFDPFFNTETDDAME